MEDGELGDLQQLLGKTVPEKAISMTPGLPSQPINNHVGQIATGNFVATNNKFGLINSSHFGAADLKSFQE